jgi:hypothetical protein
MLAKAAMAQFLPIDLEVWLIIILLDNDPKPKLKYYGSSNTFQKNNRTKITIWVVSLKITSCVITGRNEKEMTKLRSYILWTKLAS